MFSKLVTFALGGIWSTRIRLNTSKNRIMKKIIAFAHYHWLDERGSFIGESASFSDIPILPHGITGIFISGSAKIRKNCVIFPQVTIGLNTLPDLKGKGVPTIGARVIGNVVVGNNCRIGAGCVVTEDVPDNCLVTMPKPVIPLEKVLIIDTTHTLEIAGSISKMGRRSRKRHCSCQEFRKSSSSDEKQMTEADEKSHWLE